MKAALKWIVIAWLGFVVLCMLSVDCGTWRYLEDAKVGRTKADLRVLTDAIQKLATDSQFTAKDWDAIDDLQTVAHRLDPHGIIDPWGDPYILEQRDEDGRIIITVRSNHAFRDGELGIEIIVTRQGGRVTETRNLWH